MLQPVNNPCQVYFELPPIGDRNQDTPHPQVPSSTERDTKNKDDDDMAMPKRSTVTQTTREQPMSS